MKTRSTALALGLVLALTGASCKKTQEGESKNWERNTKRAQELMALYPGFAPAIQAQMAKAQEAMTAAKAISSPEESARKMSESNSLLSGGFMGTLGGLQGKVKNVREKMASASTGATGPDQAGAQTVVADAQRILASTDEMLKRGAADPVGAAAVVSKIDGDLTEAAKNLDKVIEANKKREAAAKGTPGAAPAAAAAAGAGAQAEKAVPATWKCKYCAKANDGTVAKCKGCGAPR